MKKKTRILCTTLALLAAAGGLCWYAKPYKEIWDTYAMASADVLDTKSRPAELDGCTVPEDWTWVTLGELSVALPPEITAGETEYFDDGRPCLLKLTDTVCGETGSIGRLTFDCPLEFTDDTAVPRRRWLQVFDRLGLDLPDTWTTFDLALYNFSWDELRLFPRTEAQAGSVLMQMKAALPIRNARAFGTSTAHGLITCCTPDAERAALSDILTDDAETHEYLAIANRYTIECALDTCPEITFRLTLPVSLDAETACTIAAGIQPAETE